MPSMSTSTQWNHCVKPHIYNEGDYVTHKGASVWDDITFNNSWLFNTLVTMEDNEIPSGRWNINNLSNIGWWTWWGEVGKVKCRDETDDNKTSYRQLELDTCSNLLLNGSSYKS